MDILFSLPNFARFAEAPFKGLTDSILLKAQISDSQYGANNPMHGKTHTPESKAKMSDSQQLVDRSGANNPRYIITPQLMLFSVEP